MIPGSYRVSIIVPSYQSAVNLPDLAEAMLVLRAQLESEAEMELILVDDGSTDDTWMVMQELLDRLQSKMEVVLVKLSGNFGSYPAFLAGMHHASGDACIQLHADMQDPPEHIPQMIALWKQGFKLVIGQRVGREEKGIYRFFADFYHKLMKSIALRHIPEGGYDLMVFDRQLKEEVVRMNERNINMVYLISWLQFPYVTVPVVRRIRTKGKSQWTFRRQVKLILDSLVGFSYFPIQVVTYINLLMVVLWFPVSITGLFGLIDIRLMEWILYTGLMGISLGIAVLAEYGWRTLEASRKRPPFVVDRVVKKGSSIN